MDSYLCFRLALPYSVSYFFFRYGSPLLLCTIFHSIPFNIDGVVLINPHANVFVYKDLITHSAGTDRGGELWYNFSISNDLTQMVKFSTQIPDCDSLLDVTFFLLGLVFFLQ